jgi:glycerophosphoryl diester phosphodiesterase
MIILAHRGCWRENREKNTRAALVRAFEAGYGIETDVRDLDGELVVSHDPARRGALSWNELLDLYAACGAPGRLAINIKADGLADGVIRSLCDRDLADHGFVFDMSIPDMRAYLGGPVAVYTRFSDAEPTPAFYDQAQGDWVDDFTGAWASSARALDDLGRGKSAALVSPELHGKPHLDAWDVWGRDFRRAADRRGPFGERLMICTDRPDEAKERFTGL